MIFKELKDYELEFKFLIENENYGRAIRKVYMLFKNKKINGFAIDEKWQKSKKIKPSWKKRIIRKYGIYYFYGSNIGNKIVNDVILLRKRKRNFFRTKQKLSDEKSCTNNKFGEFVKKRLESKGEYIHYNNKNVNGVINALEKSVRRKLFLVGVNYRRRLIFYVFNIETKRSYGVSVDFNKSDSSRTMQQFEIEYRGIHGKPARNPERPIVIDIIFLAESISKFLNENKTVLKPTKLTKFGWLLNQYKHKN